MGKILIINKEIPYPPHKNGNTNTIYNLIKAWKDKGNEVTLIYLNDFQSESEIELKKLKIEIININIKGKEYFIKYNGKYILKLRNSWDINSNNFPKIDVEKYDYVIFGDLGSTLIIDKLENFSKVSSILFQADSLAMYYERNKELTKNLLKKIYCILQKKIIKKYEKEIYKDIDKIIFVSEKDKEYVETYHKDKKIKSVKLGIERYTKRGILKLRKEEIDIGFSGIMSYEPNKIAAEFIIKEILPKLIKKKLNYRIHLIGKEPIESWKNLEYVKNNKLVITGYLENIDDYISNMDIYISPLFLGSGMKNKILQAMNLGIPIIASNISCDGITELKDHENFLLCDNQVENWIDKIEELAQDKNKRRDFSKKGIEIIKKNYSWSKMADEILND